MPRSRSTWIALALLALAAATWRIWAATAEDRPSAAAALAPHEMLQRELLRRNAAETGDPALAAKFADLNARHFQGALPAIPVRWEPRLADVGARAVPPFTLQGMYGRIGTRAVILLDPSLRGDPAALARVLSHEMVHASLASSGEGRDDSSEHGPAFQAVLRRLAAEGAFEGVLATDEERMNLRTWLTAESSRLEGERELMSRLTDELHAERGAVEGALADLGARIAAAHAAGAGGPTEADVTAATARRDAYNQRAIDVTDRAARDREDLEHFNREVERYNLMLAYPDGLDARALIAPKPIPNR